MKLFGEYLVESGLISEEQLLVALIDQLESIPVLVSEVHRLSMLAPEQVVEAIQYQSEHAVEFRTACKALGFWGPHFDSHIAGEASKVRLPLGQILIRKGALSSEQVTKALEGFFKLREATAPETSPKPTEPKTDRPNVKILLIDDSKAVHAYLRQCLEGAPYQVEGAWNGKEGLERLTTFTPSLILLDWEMPVLNGPDTFEQIKKLGLRIPVIMMTTRNSVEDITRMLEAGVSEYILKPFTRDILLDKLQMFLGQSA